MKTLIFSAHHHDHHHEESSHQHAEHAHPKAQDDHGGHNEHAGHHTEDFLKRFWICLVITIPVLLPSHMIQQWAGFTLSFTGDKYVLLALSSFIFIYGGGPFLTGLVRELKHRVPGMMTVHPG